MMYKLLRFSSHLRHLMRFSSIRIILTRLNPRLLQRVWSLLERFQSRFMKLRGTLSSLTSSDYFARVRKLTTALQRTTSGNVYSAHDFIFPQNTAFIKIFKNCWMRTQIFQWKNSVIKIILFYLQFVFISLFNLIQFYINKGYSLFLIGNKNNKAVLCFIHKIHNVYSRLSVRI